MLYKIGSFQFVPNPPSPPPPPPPPRMHVPYLYILIYYVMARAVTGGRGAWRTEGTNGNDTKSFKITQQICAQYDRHLSSRKTATSDQSPNL